jgi:hypothetical protein
MNPVGRAIRPVALGRKNHLCGGSDGGGACWATVCTPIEICKSNGVESYAYLNDVLTRMVGGHPINRIVELLPWAGKAANHVKTCRRARTGRICLARPSASASSSKSGSIGHGGSPVATKHFENAPRRE